MIQTLEKLNDSLGRLWLVKKPRDLLAGAMSFPVEPHTVLSVKSL